MIRQSRAHYIHGNAIARVPSRFVIFDTEAKRTRDNQGELQTWALAVAAFMEVTKQGSFKIASCRYSDPTELWQAISSFTRESKRTVVYAHNLNYDLRISRALSILPHMGWIMKDMRLEGRGSWSKWSREKTSLTLCDSASIFPTKLQEIAALIGMQKLPLPADTEQDKLFARCERDVEILTEAIRQYVEWLRTGELGNWQMTGASQSWAHWRHGHYTDRILVHNDDKATAAERAAMHTGRCEAWRWGTYTDRILTEYDWRNSYPRIARDTEVPTQFMGTVRDCAPDNIARLAKRYRVLAELDVTTDVPCVPARIGDRTVWPVGNFHTVLWDAEVSLLSESDAEFHVRCAWIYRKAPALRQWANWILYELNSPYSDKTELQKLILKHWSRTLIGRFGMRYKSWIPYAVSEEFNIRLSTMVDIDEPDLRELLQIGNNVFVSGELREIEDGAPQITSYVMASARAKLWRAMCTIGLSHVYYVDTDSLVVDATGHKRIHEMQNDPIFDGLRSKGQFRRAEIYGPRAVVFDSKPVVAGMPRQSVRVTKEEWQGETWRGAMQSVRLGEHSSVRVSRTAHTLRYNNSRREFLADGTTRAYRADGMASEPTQIVWPDRQDLEYTNDYPAMLSHGNSRRRNAKH